MPVFRRPSLFISGSVSWTGKFGKIKQTTNQQNMNFMWFKLIATIMAYGATGRRFGHSVFWTHVINDQPNMFSRLNGIAINHLWRTRFCAVATAESLRVREILRNQSSSIQQLYMEGFTIRGQSIKCWIKCILGRTLHNSLWFSTASRANLKKVQAYIFHNVAAVFFSAGVKKNFLCKEVACSDWTTITMCKTLHKFVEKVVVLAPTIPQWRGHQIHSP